jgi:hypothetical protein
MTYFYRYEAVEYAILDHDGEFASPKFPNPKLEISVFSLFKETEKGYWIGYEELKNLKSTSKWVSKTSKKRYAYPSKKEALNNFIKRTERRISILQYQKESSSIALKIAVNLINTL